MRPARRAAWVLGGVCIGLLIVVGANRLRGPSANELAFAETSVVVTAKLPTEAFFPIEFLIANDFQSITDVRISCIVDRFVTGEVDLIDTDTSGRDAVPAMARGTQRPFTCPAPAELSPPFRLGEVRRAHVSVEVLFSIPGRRGPLGVRQDFDLVGDPVRRSFWQAAAPVSLADRRRPLSQIASRADPNRRSIVITQSYRKDNA